MKTVEVKSVLDGLDGVRMGVVGDFCVDIYWYADMKLSELSRETPHFPLPVVEERFSPGAAGNVAANLAALGLRSVEVCGVAGPDWRGALLTQALERCGVDASGLIVEDGRFTNAYCKPMRAGISDVVYEDPRIDFATHRPISPKTEERVLSWLESAAERLDGLCVCDQLAHGVITPRVREKLSELSRRGLLITVDSRYRVGEFHGVTIKPNEVECRRAIHGEDSAYIETGETALIFDACDLSVRTSSNVLLTMGRRGSAFCSGGKLYARALAHEVPPPIDFCGAGDTFLSAFTALAASGALVEEAMHIAGLASEVTIRKIGVTGTATREEILSRSDEVQE